VSDPVQEEILIRSARRCALCFGLDGKLDRVRGQLAHVDRNQGNSRPDNLAYLCLSHHDEYDSRTSQSKNFTERELRAYRDRLYDAIQQGLHHSRSERTITVRSDYLEHDREAFQVGDSILSEAFLREFLDQLADDHSFYIGLSSRLSRFVEHFRTESARYLLSDLIDPLTELLQRIEQLDRFIAAHCFVYPNLQNGDDPRGLRCCLYPDHNVDRSGTGAPGEWEFYERHAKLLQGRIDAVRDAYAEYRRTIKRTLVV
jgi:hypothetical protein